MKPEPSQHLARRDQEQKRLRARSSLELHEALDRLVVDRAAEAGQFHVWQAPRPGQPDPRGLLEHLAHFYNGGTEPYGPLVAALETVQAVSDELQRADILVITDGLQWTSVPAYATERGEERRDDRGDRRDDRRDARDTRQEGREAAREAKQECKKADDKSNRECRQEKRDTKQDAREDARDIKRK